MTLAVERLSFGWAVFRDGTPVTPQLSSRYLAANALARLERKARIKVRPCLCCGASFKSEGPHNRLCNSCRCRRDHDGSV